MGDELTGEAQMKSQQQSLSVNYMSSDSEKDADSRSEELGDGEQDSKIEMGSGGQREIRPSSQEPLLVIPSAHQVVDCLSSSSTPEFAAPSFSKMTVWKNNASQKNVLEQSQTVNAPNHPLKPVNIYSHILAGIQSNLTLRKKRSEVVIQGSSSQAQLPVTPVVTSGLENQPDLEDIFEVESIKEISDLPGLAVVKRLSCFENICPSDVDGDAPTMMRLSKPA